MSSTTMANQPAPKKPLWQRLLPLVVLVGIFGAFFALGLDQYISAETLRDNRDFLKDFVAANAVGAALIYILIYVVVVAASIPGGAILTVAGGFLFGSIFGTFYTVLGATIGATCIFLAARYSFGDAIRAKLGGPLEKVLDGFKENAFSYLMVLRLVPAVPFFVANVAPAFAPVSLRLYMLTTFFGIIPGTFVFSQIGAGLDSVFAKGENLSLAGALTPDVLGALIGLALLSLMPIAYKKFKARKQKAV